MDTIVTQISDMEKRLDFRESNVQDLQGGVVLWKMNMK